MDESAYIDQFGRWWHGPYPFDPASVGRHAPKNAQGVYQIMYGNTIAYIGIATKNNTIANRLRAHVRGKGNWALGDLSEPENFTFVYFPCDDETACQIEAHVVTTSKPPFNVRPEYKSYIAGGSIMVH
jgi:hypothetical protein